MDLTRVKQVDERRLVLSIMTIHGVHIFLFLQQQQQKRRLSKIMLIHPREGELSNQLSIIRGTVDVMG